MWSGLDPAGLALGVRGQVHTVNLCGSGAEGAVGSGSEGGSLARGEDRPSRSWRGMRWRGMSWRDWEMGIEELEEGVFGNYDGVMG